MVRQWEVEGVGFRLQEIASDTPGPLENHAVWADNLYLFVPCDSESVQIVGDGSVRLYSTVGAR